MRRRVAMSRAAERSRGSSAPDRGAAAAALPPPRLDVHTSKVVHQRGEDRGEVQAEVVVVQSVTILREDRIVLSVHLRVGLITVEVAARPSRRVVRRRVGQRLGRQQLAHGGVALQPYVREAAAVCERGCNLVTPKRTGVSHSHAGVRGAIVSCKWAATCAAKCARVASSAPVRGVQIDLGGSCAERPVAASSACARLGVGIGLGVDPPPPAQAPRVRARTARAAARAGRPWASAPRRPRARAWRHRGRPAGRAPG
eukprot:scaffold10546_cov59-Phaeocystis_antarctica.AAC.1